MADLWGQSPVDPRQELREFGAEGMSQDDEGPRPGEDAHLDPEDQDVDRRML